MKNLVWDFTETRLVCFFHSIVITLSILADQWPIRLNLQATFVYKQSFLISLSLKNGPTRPLFAYFHPFHMANKAQIWLSMIGTRTRAAGCRRRRIQWATAAQLIISCFLKSLFRPLCFGDSVLGCLKKSTVYCLLHSSVYRVRWALFAGFNDSNDGVLPLTTAEIALR